MFELEGEIRRVVSQLSGWLLRLLGSALEERDARLAKAHCRCPVCEECRMTTNGTRPVLALELLEGTLPLARTYLVCRGCGYTCHPLDLSLDLPEDGEVAPRFGHDLCRLGVELTFETSREILETLTGRALDASTIRNQVDREGKALFRIQCREAEIHGDLTLGARKRARCLKELPRIHSQIHPEGVLLVEVDGVMGSLGGDREIREQIRDWERREGEARRLGQPFDEARPSSFREVLQARVYQASMRVSKTTRSGRVRTFLAHSETVSVVNDPERFRSFLYALAEAWGFSKHRLRVLIADGAVFDRNLAEGLSFQVEILDYQHAKSHVYDCAKALFGVGSSQARQWGKRWADSLWESGAAPLLTELARLSEASWDEEGTRRLMNLVDYVTRHRRRMDYHRFRAQNLPVASGAIESANRQIVGDRCKRSGMRWSKQQLQHLLSLRAALLSGLWDEVCAAIRGERSKARKAEARIQERREADRRRRLVEKRPMPLPPTPMPPPNNPRTSLVPEWKLARRAASGLLSYSSAGLELGSTAAA